MYFTAFNSRCKNREDGCVLGGLGRLGGRKREKERLERVSHSFVGAQACPALCDPMDCNPPGFSVYGIFQARILEWFAISLDCVYFQLPGMGGHAWIGNLIEVRINVSMSTEEQIKVNV